MSNPTKVFLSYSGQDAKEVAECLKEALESVIPAAEYVLSHQTIQPGTHWPRELLDELRTSDFGVVCVTQEGLGSHWLHFEAGVLAGRGELEVPARKERRFIAFLVDVSVGGLRSVDEPLALFQPAEFDHKGFTEIALAINGYTQRPRQHNVVLRAVEAAWGQVDEVRQDLRLRQNLGPAPTADAPLLGSEAAKTRALFDSLRQAIPTGADRALKLAAEIEQRVLTGPGAPGPEAGLDQDST